MGAGSKHICLPALLLRRWQCWIDGLACNTQGKLAATAVNAPMVSAEVLAELQPFVALAQGLGRTAVQLVGDQGLTDISITYATPRGDELDTRLLRAMVIKVCSVPPPPLLPSNSCVVFAPACFPLIAALPII